ncbi:hypothetical protein [Dorea formicigenerans]|uniref:hypothetical protein n=1 Tax=Dorea formicigenerans TaxID=39486 RepID=UPI000E51AFD2|nr:hypothetical protein [Dorea formicigenerans]RGT39300.1 hypothetical protein DWX30_09500 [Dorea formicigenerans]RHC49263.1 hypothetical protein DW838_07920 [Dorea formicigenerans]
MVKGLDTFQKYFADYEEQYVLIGGAACDILFESNEVMLMYGKVSQENYVELTAASAIPNKEIKSPQILRY